MRRPGKVASGGPVEMVSVAGAKKAIAEADEWLKHNQPIPHEEVLAELGWRKNQKWGMAKRIAWTQQAKADIRAIERPIALQIL